MALKNNDFNKIVPRKLMFSMVFTLSWVCCSGMAFAQKEVQRDVPSFIESSQAGLNARIEVLGSPWRSAHAIGVSQSRILVYRTPDSELGGATSVFVNGQYHSSLVPGAYSELCYAPGNIELGARQFKTGNLPRDRMDSISALNLAPGKTHYLKVREENGRPVMHPVAEMTAHQELAGLRVQMHTISRVSRAQACQEVAVATALNQPKQISLAADALFAFGKSDAQSMSIAGRQSLDRLVQALRNDYISLDRIHVVGHADPVGKTVVNERLSLQRALTVRDYLINNGLSSTRITGEGRGARDPVVTNCGTQISPAVMACNQVNRRVVVDIFGQQR